MFGFAACVTLLLFRLLNHAMWRDEAQSWLIALHAGSIVDLLIIDNEGHPPLYYWMLYALSAFGEGLWVPKTATGVMAVGTLTLVWFAAPFTFVEKLLISLSFYLSFQYGVFSRSYILGTFLVLFFASFFRRWASHPVLGALVLGAAALTHILFALIAAALALATLISWWEDGKDVRQRIFFSVIFAICFVLSVLSVVLSIPPAWVTSPLAKAVPDDLFLWSVFRSLTKPFLEALPWPSIQTHLSALTFVLCIAAFRKAPLFGMAYFLGATAVAVSMSLIYGGASWHNGAIYVLMVALYAIGHERMNALAACGLLMLSALGNLMSLQQTLSIPYSAAEEAARLIRQFHLSEAVWGVYPDSTGTVTFAVLDRPAFGLTCGCDFTFINWRALRNSERSVKENLRVFLERSWPGQTYLLLSRSNTDNFLDKIDSEFTTERLAETGPAISDESFVLVRVAPHRRLP